MEDVARLMRRKVKLLQRWCDMPGGLSMASAVVLKRRWFGVFCSSRLPYVRDGCHRYTRAYCGSFVVVMENNEKHY